MTTTGNKIVVIARRVVVYYCVYIKDYISYAVRMLRRYMPVFILRIPTDLDTGVMLVHVVLIGYASRNLSSNAVYLIDVI